MGDAFHWCRKGMEPIPFLLCEKCKCKDHVHDINDTTCGVRHPVEKTRQCSHYSSYRDCKDNERRIENRWVGIGYRDGSSDEQSRYHSVGRSYGKHGDDERTGYHMSGSSFRDHRDDEKRTEYHRIGNAVSHSRWRHRAREKSSDSHSCRKFRWPKSRCCRSMSGRTYSTSSSDESDHGSIDNLCFNCNSTLKHHCGVEEPERKRRKLNVVCRSHGLQRSSTYLIEHSDSQCCPGILKPCCGVYSCRDRKRKHEHYSSESDAGVSRVRRSDPLHQKHRHGCYCQRSVIPHDSCNGKPCRVSQCSPFRTVRPTTQCMKHVLSSPSAGHCVHSPDVCATEHVEIPFGSKEVSSHIKRETDELWSNCTTGNVKFVDGQSENQEYQDQWLQLSLKAPQRSELKVEGVSKNDFKLSLSDDTRKLQMDDLIPSGLHKMGFHPLKETVKPIPGDGASVDFPHIDFAARRPEMDPFMYHQPMQNSHSLNFQLPSISLRNLNPPEGTVNIHSGTALVIQGRSSSGSDSSAHCSPPREEPQCTLLNWNNGGSLGMSEEVAVSEHVILSNQEIGLSSNITNFTNKEGSRDLCLGDPHFPGTSTSAAADCGIGTNGNGPSLLVSETRKELAGSIIIIGDSEDESSEQNCFGATDGKNIVVASRANVSMADEICDDDGRQDPVHESNLSYVQDMSNPGNVFGSDERKIVLEYTNTTLANKGRKDKENDVNFRIASCSHSEENLGKHVGSVTQLPDDVCGVVEVISSEDDSVDNEVCNVALQCKNETLKGREEYTLGVCVTARESDYMAIVENEDLSHEDDENCQSWDAFDENCLSRDLRSHRKRGSSPAMGKGNIETIDSSKGISSTVDSKHIEPSCAEALPHIANSKPRMWDSDIVCDLCSRGPSLMYGEWYAWCCGFRLFYCKCTEDHKRKLKLSMKPKTKKPSKKWDGHEWSGKVHRMCALWSSEVFEKDDGRDQLEGLLNAVKRGRELVCKDPLCRRYGATLGCRVKNCRRSFHYPCAERLASQLQCRMWEGFKRPVACHSHRHVDNDCVSAKDWQLHVKWNYGNNPGKATKGNKNAAIYSEKLPYEDPNFRENTFRLNLNLNIDNEGTTEVTVGNMNDIRDPLSLSMGFKGKAGSSARDRNEKLLDQMYDANRSGKFGVISCKFSSNRRGQVTSSVRFLGNNLLCEDISHGIEALKIPCTNDIDDTSIPSFEYITQSRYSEHTAVILDTVLGNMEMQAKPCKGCDKLDMDNPEGSISVHIDVNDRGREHDRRIDWQGELMLGRLPYNHYGLLQLGFQTIDVVECNSRCPCGSKCLNRELQKGLQVALEVYKTEDRGWGVRSLEQIPRGKFVVEYVGEMLTQGEASKPGLVYDDEHNASYLFIVDHPAVPKEDHLVVDGFKTSNVARFINHSCDGNLSIYRVYTETLDQRFFRIGLYACRDIEIGEELTYDYKCIPAKEPGAPSDDPGAIKCFCQAKSCRRVLLSAGS